MLLRHTTKRVAAFAFAASMTDNAAANKKIAAVTGANKGIGYHVAQQLAKSGLFGLVVLGCRDAQRGQEAVQSIQSTLSDGQTTTTQVKCFPLELGNYQSHEKFKSLLQEQDGELHLLVNNAAMAFKGADPTPFVEQTKPTLDVNFRATVALTDSLLPLIPAGGRIVNVASRSGRLSQLTSATLREKVTSPTLTFDELHSIVKLFEDSVQGGTHLQEGFGNSNYGMSKLALIAATKIWARENPSLKVNCCCPGYCRTDMSSQRGPREPSEGAKNAVIPATMEDPPTGAFFSDFVVAEW